MHLGQRFSASIASGPKFSSSVDVTRQKNYQYTKVNKNVLYDHEVHRCKIINMTSGGHSEEERLLKKILKNDRR